MTSYHSKIPSIEIEKAAKALSITVSECGLNALEAAEAARGLRRAMHQVKCNELMWRWYMLLDYEDLEAWFESNRCCLPIALSKVLRNGSGYIKTYTTL